MCTIQKLHTAVQRLQREYIPGAKARRFRLGVRAFALEEFTSLNAAGRRLGVNRWTGENRIRRTVTDGQLADRLQRLLITEVLASRAGYCYLSLDHSQFGPFSIAVLAVSVRTGRAIPVWCRVDISQAALMEPVLASLEELFYLLSEEAPDLKPVLVMDRWFAADTLFRLLEEHGVYFIARTKSDKRIVLPWDPGWHRTPVGEISLLETAITYRSRPLRLVRSQITPGMKEDEPWFLLTNLPEEITRRQLLNRYAERFEIEETFKDVKWLQRLEWQQIRRPDVMRTLLLFVFLGWWLLWRYVAKRGRALTKGPDKKQLNWFRQSREQLYVLLYPPPTMLFGGGV